MSNKCRSCGGTEIDVDPARGDAVCTNCGTVLEDSAIVSDLQYEDNAHGGTSAVGQFVAGDSRGGARGFGGTFHYVMGKESREITLQSARRAITSLGQQLRLNQHCIDTAFNFYKMALSRHLTRGRKNTHVVAACVYMTCRTEGTAHLLIDCSDVLQINVYELGRTYLKLSQALCINIPSMDPCLYIMRFANQMEFGEKTHEVSMTALRLVQRMKKDFLHTGRRPSGLCGAALLIAARLNDFSRSVNDIIKIVKVHESTLRKRLLEFGETPSSSLTLDEFMAIDLEEEQDPPCFKAARLKDRERLQKVMDDEETNQQFNELKEEIEKLLDKQSKGRKKGRNALESTSEVDTEALEEERFTTESTLGIIKECIVDGYRTKENTLPVRGLGPNMASMGLIPSNLRSDDSGYTSTTNINKTYDNGELDLEGIDDEELDSYIMSEKEVVYKDSLWTKVNAEYLQAVKEKAEKLAKEKEEGKPEKKRKRTGSKKGKNLSANTPGEAINKMLKEKRISSKINYDVLKDLNSVTQAATSAEPEEVPEPEPEPDVLSASTSIEIEEPVKKLHRPHQVITKQEEKVTKPQRDIGFPLAEVVNEEDRPVIVEGNEDVADIDQDEAEVDDFEEEVEVVESEMSLTQMLNQHREDDYGDDYAGGYDYDDDY